MTLPPGWTAARAWRARPLADLPVGHALCGVVLRRLATATGSDDVLYAYPDRANVIVVHHTWQRETSPAWPGFEEFADLSAFVAAELAMLTDPPGGGEAP